MNPQIYIGRIPETSQGRRSLRARALELQLRLRNGDDATPQLIALNVSVGEGPLEQQADLLVLRPDLALIGVIREEHSPVIASPGERWRRRDTGGMIEDEGQPTPLVRVRALLEALRRRLQAAALEIGFAEQSIANARSHGALLFAPSMHADSSISLDIEDHIKGIKVLGLDELPGLIAMERPSAHINEESMHAIATTLFGCQRWHDGTRLVFELAPIRLRLRQLTPAGIPGAALPLIEGMNIIGRRRTARPDEHRLSLGGDELVSNDHARIYVADNGRVFARDVSKNGTWLTFPGRSEYHIRGIEVEIPPGTILRLGVTRLRLEAVETAPRLNDERR